MIRILDPPVRSNGARNPDLTVDAASASVIEGSRDGRGGYACFCNVHLLMEGRANEPVEHSLHAARWVFPDGTPIAIAARRAGSAAERVPGAAVMAAVLDAGREHGLRHAFVGSTERTLELMSDAIRVRFPGVVIAGLIAPPIAHDALDLDVTDAVRSLHPDVIWVGLGAPKQELWMQHFAAALAPSVLLGVGAAFDFFAGTRERAPGWMQRAGLEWLHRFSQEPRRLGKRYLKTNAGFLAGAIAEYLSHRVKHR